MRTLVARNRELHPDASPRPGNATKRHGGRRGAMGRTRSRHPRHLRLRPCRAGGIPAYGNRRAHPRAGGVGAASALNVRRPSLWRHPSHHPCRRRISPAPACSPSPTARGPFPAVRPGPRAPSDRDEAVAPTALPDLAVGWPTSVATALTTSATFAHGKPAGRRPFRAASA